ncbi:magnesium chelatase, partial [Chroococcidiopsis cubana CCALA 043]
MRPYSNPYLPLLMPELRAELNRLSEALNRVVVGQSQLV